VRHGRAGIEHAGAGTGKPCTSTVQQAERLHHHGAWRAQSDADLSFHRVNSLKFRLLLFWHAPCFGLCSVIRTPTHINDAGDTNENDQRDYQAVQA
jgi:hypothetical protein